MKNSILSDSNKIKKVYIGSNELSPFHECYSSEHLILRLAAGRYFAHYAGENTEATYWALRETAVLYDVPERPIEISGKDVVQFLEKIFSRTIEDMSEGRGRYTLACTHVGGIFMDGIIFRLATDKFWFVQPDGDLKTWLLAHQENYRVKITDPLSRALQIQGPKSFQILKDLTNGALDQQFGYFHSGFFTLDNQEVYISRTGWSGELGYEIYTNGNTTNCPQLWKYICDVGSKHGMVFSSMQSLNIRRIEAGILDSGSDFDHSLTPYEVGLIKFVDFENKNFKGRNALLASPQDNRLFGITCKETTPASGDEVFFENTQIGKVTTGAWSPYFKAGIGYVLLHNANEWTQRALLKKEGLNKCVPIEIVSLPFLDPNKIIPRTIPILF